MKIGRRIDDQRNVVDDGISDKGGERIVARSSLIGFVQARRLMLPITFIDLALPVSLSPSINRKNFSTDTLLVPP